MRRIKYLHILTAVLFVYFSYVQLNDADGWKWIGIYFSISLLAIFAFLGFKLKLISKILVTVIAIYLILNFNLLTSWIQAGKPAFIDYEPTNIQEVENIREFLGLLITLFAASAYMLIFNKK